MTRKARVLVAEDSPTQAADLRLILESEGMDVEVAPDGYAAFDRFRASPFDLVLTDVIMPGLTGYELCRRIKAEARGKTVPVVLLTTLADPEDIMQGLASGADNFIPKPYRPDHLVARLRVVLANRPSIAQGTSPSVVFRLMGRTITINQDRQQILGLLISSLEEAVRRGEELRASQAALVKAKSDVEKYARELEARVRVSEDKYRILVESASDSIFVLDMKGKIVEANRRAHELLGRRREEILGRRYHDFVPSSGGGEPDFKLMEILRSGTGEIENHCIRRPDGSIRFVDLAIARVTFGAEQFGLGIARDVTARRMEEERRTGEERQMLRLLENLPIAVYVLDGGGKPFFANRAAVEILGRGIEAGEEIGELAETHGAYVTGTDLLYPANMMPIVRALSGERSTVSDMQIRRPGRTIDLEVSAAPLHADDGSVAYAIAVLWDITERRRAAEALARTEEQLRQAQKMDSLGRLAGGVAHDFNNYLSVIRAGAEMLLADLAPDDPHRGNVEEIIAAADSSADLTRQLLAFGRRQTLMVEVVDLNDRVRAMERLLRRILPENIALDVRLSAAPVHVKVDPGQIEQVVMNLAVNARDAMAGGGAITIETCFADIDEAYVQKHAPMTPGQYVCLTLTDTGAGMDRETQERIFEPFFTTKETGKGTGLGLAMVYGIVKQSGGNIWVYSEPGRGTVFKVYLPRASEAPVEREASPTVERKACDPRTILLVEDQATLRTVARRILARAGHRVIEASDGAEAIRIAETTEEAIHLVLSDVVMPGMTGPELYRTLAERRPEMKVLFMSGYTESSMGEKGVIEAGTPFLHKPFTVVELTNKIQEAFHD